jgi:hypothetical protein
MLIVNLPPWAIVSSCVLVGLVIYLVLLLLVNNSAVRDDDLQLRAINATATNRSQAAVTIGDNSPIHQHMGPDPVPQRSLSESQRRALMKALKGVPPTTILVYRLSSRESQNYLAHFVGILKEAGWTVLDFLSTATLHEQIIRVAWRGEITLGYKAFVKGLNAAGIAFTEDEVKSDDSPSVRVLFDVGRAKMEDFQAAADRFP